MTLTDIGGPCWAPQGEHDYVKNDDGIFYRCVHCDRLDPERHWTEESGQTPYRVICRGSCGPVNLTSEQYDRQMMAADRLWCCPRCGENASWDDNWYESYIDQD